MSNQREEKSNNLLKILEEGEVDDLFARPLFTDEERQIYFSLSAPERPVFNIRVTYCHLFNTKSAWGCFSRRCALQLTCSDVIAKAFCCAIP